MHRHASNLRRSPSYRSAGRSYGAVRLGFIAAELELAKTFYEVSTNTMDSRRARRNALFARVAFATAQYCFSQGHFAARSSPAVQAARKKMRVTGAIIARLDSSANPAVA